MAVDGAATFDAAEKVAIKAKNIAAHLLEASSDDIELDEDGAHVVGSPDSTIEWGEIAAASVVATLPLVGIVLLFQRRIVRGLAAGAVKG